MKPIIKIIIVVLIIIIIGLIIYFVWSALAPAPINPPSTNNTGSLPVTSSTDTTTPNQTQNNQTQLGGQEITLKKVSENLVFDFWADPQTKEVYYINPDGQVFSAKEGEDIQITQQKLNAPNFIKVSPNGQRVLMAFGAPRAPQWGIFDVIDGAWRPLPTSIINATWGADSGTLIASVKNGGDINLSSVNISQAQPSYKIIVKDLRLEDVKMEFIQPNNLIISEISSVNYPARAWNLDLKNLSIYQLFSPQSGLIMKYSTDKNVLFSFSTNNGFKILNIPSLSLVIPLPFSTLPSKCSPDSSIVYCFVPSEETFKNSTLPDDYIKQKFYTSDTLFRINSSLDDVLPVVLPENAGVIDAQNPIVLNNSLYFINRYDKSLYSLGLK